MKQYILTACASLALILSASATTPLHYTPLADGSGAVCTDGTVKYNRGLYGAHSGFRIDCSDMPEFGIYLPRMGGNLRLTLPEGKCEAVYIPGKMLYTQGGVVVEAQVGRTTDAALWKITNTGKSVAEVGVSFGGVAEKKFSREGDLGVDPADCFDLKPAYCAGNIYTFPKKNIVNIEYGPRERKTLSLVMPLDTRSLTDLPSLEGSMRLKPGESRIIALFPAGEQPVEGKKLTRLFEQAEAERSKLANTFGMQTPDPWINPIGPAIAVAADGIWSGSAWLHGSIGWRTPHLGWRGAYAGDALGMHDRALTHFRTYAANQITDIPATSGHPSQDSTLNLARSEKRWGTPMYSNGYICRRPGKKDEMSHYDMNLVYADAMLRHFRHTGDTAVMRELYPVMKRHLEWEKLNFDPDGDHLYDAYCCIWASDALYYSGGAVTHSSAYNMLANKAMADVARIIGEDPSPYRAEAEAIGRAIDSVLWIDERGHWAEFKDRGHGERLHPAAAVWTIYHAIDSEIADPFKAYAATAYVDRDIPHIAVDDSLYTISTTNWKPYSWSINNVAIAEVMHTALAYWQAGRADEAFRLMKGVVMDNMYQGASPLNFGQISQYDIARGECYRDFADPIGVWSRALTEGLYGIRPNLIAETPVVEVIPGFPADWDKASIDLPDISYSFDRHDACDTYNIKSHYPEGTHVKLTARASGLSGVYVNGKETTDFKSEISFGEPRISIDLPLQAVNTVEIRRNSPADGTPTGNIRTEGPVTFTEMAAGPLKWWEAAVGETAPLVAPLPEDFTAIAPDKCEPMDISGLYNASVSDIFHNSYMSPRPDVTTLQLPTQGIGEWCHPKDTAHIDDSGLRALVASGSGILHTPLGIDFAMPSEGSNILFTTLWDNYPDSASMPLSGSASHIYLLMAGSVNHMQWGMESAEIRIDYADGTHTRLPLVSPLNWAPIEQDFFTDNHAFSQPGGAPNPYRISFADGRVSRNLLNDIAGADVPIDPGMELGKVNGRRFESGAGVLVDVPVATDKELKSLTLTTLGHDVVTGIMAITVQRP